MKKWNHYKDVLAGEANKKSTPKDTSFKKEKELLLDEAPSQIILVKVFFSRSAYLFHLIPIFN